MPEQIPFLEEVHIKDFLSLRNVSFPLKQLTILVGSNASGKSNILNGLRLLNEMMIEESLPSFETIKESLWAGGASRISFEVKVRVDDTPTLYQLELSKNDVNPLHIEQLTIGDIEVISVQNGRGEVRNEDDATLVTPYHPTRPKLALTSAGDYGDRPVTSALNDFIQDWHFYNFQPSAMRTKPVFQLMFAMRHMRRTKSVRLDHDGSMLNVILTDWAENHEELFESVNDALYASTNLKMETRLEDGEMELYLQEGYKSPIPLKKASDGTLRLIAYYVLLNQPELPSLIAIEEPERNLHPAILTDIASVLEQLAERTQVIITTHSSQLLDAFNAQNLCKTLAVLLLRNISGRGTEVINIANTRQSRAAFDGWIEDFGLGSAIFESELLQDFVER